MDHGDINPCLTTLGVVFVVLGQPPITVEPTESPLHDPPPLMNLERRLTRTLVSYLQHPTTVALDPIQQRPHPVGRVRPHLGQMRQRLTRTPEHFHRSLPIG